MDHLDLDRLLALWGPGLLILMGLGVLALRLGKISIEKMAELKMHQFEALSGAAKTYCDQFLSTQQKQAHAIERVAEAVARGNEKDQVEHREIFMALRVLNRKVTELLWHQKGNGAGPRRAPRSAKANNENAERQT